MANYVRTGPFVNGTVPGISAAFLNAVEAVLEQPSGGVETGKYFLNSGSSVSGFQFGTYTCSLSRTAVPVSAVVDAADVGASNCVGGATSSLSANGFMVNTSSNAVNTNCRVAGNYTLSF
jgi:hypothetical protein